MNYKKKYKLLEIIKKWDLHLNQNKYKKIKQTE